MPCLGPSRPPRLTWSCPSWLVLPNAFVRRRRLWTWTYQGIS